MPKKRNQKSSLLTKFDSLFREEYRNDLETLINQMKREKKPERFIRRKQIKVRLDWIQSEIRRSWDNPWLPKNKENKPKNIENRNLEVLAAGYRTMSKHGISPGGIR
jgi:hypothetical protein